MSRARSGASETLGLGRPAPGFMARNQHGELLAVSGLRGAPAVIIFYPWAYSSICRDELAAIRDDHERFVALRTRVLAVSCDAMFTLRAYADAEGIQFDLLSDHWPHGAIAQAYGVFDEVSGCARRGTFLLDSAGLIRWQQVNQINESRELASVLAAAANL
ncbi:MAG TPA: redoxin domain-containing protein [Propionibacteriaceae bacterium]|nr:redoxin domain-containing protein [Propionibacteriaceae bacterium]